ncbi:MAG: hypothetical protein EPO68_13885 [Planctomycetota bacterium]|nr:MAG: hypothetical protein EPO68_13885 [Planctomycetota bacterium]
MPRLTIALCTSAAAAVAVYLWRPGAQGLGAAMGISMGAGLAALGVLWIAREARRGGMHAFRAQTLFFLAKLGVLTVGAIALRYIPQLSDSADWRMWLLAFLAASVIVMFIGLWGMFPRGRAALAHGAATNGDRLQ